MCRLGIVWKRSQFLHGGCQFSDADDWGAYQFCCLNERGFNVNYFILSSFWCGLVIFLSLLCKVWWLFLLYQFYQICEDFLLGLDHLNNASKVLSNGNTKTLIAYISIFVYLQFSATISGMLQLVYLHTYRGFSIKSVPHVTMHAITYGFLNNIANEILSTYGNTTCSGFL